MGDNLLDVIGGIGFELEKLQMSIQNEREFCSKLEDKHRRLLEEVANVRAKTELLEQNIRKAELHSQHELHNLQLAKRSAELARQHTLQLAEKADHLRAVAEMEDRQVRDRLAQLAQAVDRQADRAGAAGLAHPAGAKFSSLAELVEAKVAERLAK